MEEQVLIVTCKQDLHPTSVINLLNENQIPFFRLNTEALMTDYIFSWTCINQEIDLHIKDLNTKKEIYLSQIHSVWYRRAPYPSEMPYTVDEKVDKHNIEEAKQFYLYLMYYISDFYSIGNHFWDKYANSKLNQFREAIKLGVKIPDTCLTNNKRDLNDFISKFDNVILKPLHDYGIWYSADRTYPLYATKISSSSLLLQSEESISQTVNFCEDYVEKKYEVRVTVMGNHIFACKLDSQSQTEDTGKIDWRQGYDHQLRHELIQLPNDIEEFCRKYLRRFHLNFGCFDFILTPKDEYVFLECNPNGQWGWIEDETKAPMSEAMVDCLVNLRRV